MSLTTSADLEPLDRHRRRRSEMSALSHECGVQCRAEAAQEPTSLPCSSRTRIADPYRRSRSEFHAVMDSIPGGGRLTWTDKTPLTVDAALLSIADMRW
jgi:hypothetical protein